MKEQAQTEQQMREATVPWPATIEELVEYINSLTERTHDYGTCVYAMSMAAVATFNYVASKEDCTGFQASCADLDILRRTRSIDAPFMIVNLNDTLYPQYDKLADVQEFITKNAKWRKDRAIELLKKNPDLSNRVSEHWKQLAAL